MRKLLPFIAAAIFLMPFAASAENVGSVVTEKKFIGKNSVIRIEVIDDPQIAGVSCWLSYPVKGGARASIGLGEDPSNSSIACRATGSIDLKTVLRVSKKEGVDVFKRMKGMFFKAMRVVRFYDKRRKTLVYLTYTKELIGGSPKSSISTVVIPSR
jgi:CreA protein